MSSTPRKKVARKSPAEQAGEIVQQPATWPSSTASPP